MYFIIKQDPDYTIKGSRDPLGFQVIWQDAGKKLIPYLSTVSSSITDFQIICLAHYFKEELDIKDENFESFFICFEQLMAYTRFKKDRELGFNGIDKVRKISDYGGKAFEISTNQSQQILSNQKAYGVWGKYIRPFRDMDFTNHKEFKPVFSAKVEKNDNFFNLVFEINKKSKGQLIKVNYDRLDLFYDILEKPVGQEKDLFEEKLLIDSCEREMLRIFNENDSVEYPKLSFYSLLDFIDNNTQSHKLKGIINLIRNTEKVLCPLNRIFRLLQTQSSWKKADIEANEHIKKWRTEVDVTGFNQTLLELAESLKGSNWDLVQSLVRRNKLVSEKRGSNPWVQEGTLGLDVNHFEGAFVQSDFKPAVNNDNSYFLHTYTNLYRQLTD